MKRIIHFTASLIALGGLATSEILAQSPFYQVGVARIDITPDYPVRLSGYAVRATESEGVEQRLWAKALAVGRGGETSVLFTVDNLAVPEHVRDAVAARLAKKAGINPERITVCSSHTHTAPMLSGLIENLFGYDLPAGEKERIDRYTRELTGRMEQVALEALKNRAQAHLSWAQGQAQFARNRRTPGGPVDHDLPVLKATDKNGKLRAILFNYACHCTTLGGDFNRICGDWAGYAQEFIERDNPGVIALAAIGCGADANPHPRPGLEPARQHGQEIAAEIGKLLTKTFTPIRGPLECRTKRIRLPFDTLPTREEWETRARGSQPYIAYHAKKNLARLDRGERLQTELPYLVQTWNFGRDLAMVFLPGEVVVDYALRLKKEFDATRLWVTAYANDVPCYIPSRRILKEGGYEGGGAMIYYDRPAKLAMETEDLIINAVHELMPEDFLFDEKAAASPPPKSPADALVSMRTKAGFKVELVAAEPLIVDPVAIDFAPDGKLWVLEMRDYPRGMDDNWKPGGRVKVLEDLDRDGVFDKSTLFLDDLPFPTGLMVWKRGVIVCAAPDILFAEDTTGDGRADVVKKLFTGFATHNYNARVNSPRWRMDGWVSIAAGLFGGTILSHVTGQEFQLNRQDFRIKPDTGRFEPVSGLTQQGRVRDDWGNWFGCDNSNPIWQFPLPDHYLRRNPHVTAPNPRVRVSAASSRVYPISRTLERFNHPESANHFTSICGLEILRDPLLGGEFYGNAFLGETAHNTVNRFVLTNNGVIFTGHRAPEEQDSEFLASTDNWFRPVEMRTGPDGALWVVDMYRAVIEHTEWIPAEMRARVDVRAGDDRGRIYRVYPEKATLRTVSNLQKLSTRKLVAALDTPNGPQRDLIHQELLARHDSGSIAPLARLAANSNLPQVRVQALWILEGLGALTPELLHKSLRDEHVEVRKTAIRLCEPFAAPELLDLTSDPDPGVRWQLALSLGEWNDPRAGVALGRLAQAGMNDLWQRAAILSSAVPHVNEIVRAVLDTPADQPGRADLLGQLLVTAAKSGDMPTLDTVLAQVTPEPGKTAEPWQLTAMTSLLDAVPGKKDAETQARIAAALVQARQLAGDEQRAEKTREAAIRLLAHGAESDLRQLAGLLRPPASPRLQAAALDGLRRSRSAQTPRLLLADWLTHSPATRSSIIDALFSRDAWIGDLLGAIENGTVAGSEISAAHRQRLLAHTNESVKARAAALLRSSSAEARAEVLARYGEVTKLSGDAAGGAGVFERNCASCHVIRGVGFSVGSDISSWREKSTEDFLTAILDPNAAIDPNFANYQIELKDGRSLSGIVQGETATGLTLVQGGGLTENILRSDVLEMRASSLSLMPEGLEAGISPREMADLIAYLKSGAPAAFGSASLEDAARARQEFSQAGAIDLAKVIAAAETIPYPSFLGALQMAHCRQNDGNSRIIWQTQPVSSSLTAAEKAIFRLPAAMGHSSQPAGKFQLKLNGRDVLEFDVTLQDRSWQSADGRVLMRYTVHENNREDSNGVLVIEVDGALLEPGRAATFEVTGSAAGSRRWFGIYQLQAGK